jgi:hypothetical protein
MSAASSDEQPSDASSSNATGSGLFGGGFETYRTMTDEDYRSLLRSGLVVLDTNALLNLYRYHAKTREDLLEILAHIRDRLWVPYHAMYEFWENRLSVIDTHSNEIEGIIDGLFKSRSELERGIRTWANRVGLTPEETAEVVGTVASAVRQVTDKIREMSVDDTFEHAEDTSRDPVIVDLLPILQGKVGDPLTPDELRKAKKEAIQRNADKRPPGWKDAGKRANPEGDYIVWFQTLQEAKRRGVSVIFVTGDVKDDWWRKEHGEVKGPLPELVYEMRVVADVQLFMLRPASLLIHASDMLGLRVSEESVQDAQRVSSRGVMGDDIRVSLRELAAELLAMQQEMYLTDLNPDIVRALRRASMELYDALRDSSAKDPVDAVWPVINAAVDMGLLGRAQESLSETRLGTQTIKLRLLLDEIYINAIKAWLNQIVDLYVGERSGHQQAFSYTGPFPPMVAAVGERFGSSLRDSQRVNFTAVIVDGREVSITRIVRKVNELFPRCIRFWILA